MTQSVVDHLSDGHAAHVDLPRFEVRDLPAAMMNPGDAAWSLSGAVDATEGYPQPVRHDVNLDELQIDQDAAKVVKRLTRSGHEAYLVGGCVRDLLLGCSPKDFDVATSALPEDVRRLFRNSRVIGRRFRLVHVLYAGGKVIETATFRRAPLPDDEGERSELLIRSDNEFGRAHEDARRRDFTVNGLFYDIDSKQVLDWVGGMPDIARRTINTIGDPVVRFQEDPIRILRAIKFAARLDCGMTPEVYDAIVQCRSALAMAARPRLFEELLRLLRGGAAHRSLWLAWETGVLDVLLPELAAYLCDEGENGGNIWRAFSEIDRRTKARGEPLSDVVLCSVLMLEPMLEACQFARDRLHAAGRFLDPIVDRLNVPRRIAEAMRRIAAVLPRLQAGKGGRFQRSALHAEAKTVVDIRAASLQGASAPQMAPAPPSARPARRRRKRSAPSASVEV